MTIQRFRRRIRISGVIRLMDCFLVTCRKPNQNEDAYYNYKVGHASNVQVVICFSYTFVETLIIIFYFIHVFI